jgi:hypothetical protein
MVKAEYAATTFEHFRQDFLAKHQVSLLQSLQHVFGQTTFEPAPVSDLVKNRFMAALKSAKKSQRMVHAGFHGSAAKNYESIFDRGLLIPGDGNELRVVNGAAFGRGIYIAQEHAAWLSFGFCSEPRMLICAVIDMGHVKFHGAAMVVSASNHVIPLFEAVSARYQDKIMIVPRLLSRLAKAHVTGKTPNKETVSVNRRKEQVVQQLRL